MKDKNSNDKNYGLLFAGVIACIVIVLLVFLTGVDNEFSYDSFKQRIQLLDVYNVKQENAQENPSSEAVYIPVDEKPVGEIYEDTTNDKKVTYIYNPDGSQTESSTNSSEEQGDNDAISPETLKAIKDAEKLYDKEYGSGYTGIVNINLASFDMLKSLPGVGEETAINIIEYRLRSGGFTSIEQIKEVKGIGEKKFENFKDRLTVK